MAKIAWSTDSFWVAYAVHPVEVEGWMPYHEHIWDYKPALLLEEQDVMRRFFDYDRLDLVEAFVARAPAMGRRFHTRCVRCRSWLMGRTWPL